VKDHDDDDRVCCPFFSPSDTCTPSREGSGICPRPMNNQQDFARNKMVPAARLCHRRHPPSVIHYPLSIVNVLLHVLETDVVPSYICLLLWHRGNSHPYGELELTARAPRSERAMKGYLLHLLAKMDRVVSARSHSIASGAQDINLFSSRLCLLAEN
jgi:hypothetical protein